MNALLIQNRQTEDAKGTGLPFFTKKEYQYRYWNNKNMLKAGYWQVPNNKLPTFQLWHTKDLDTFELWRVGSGGGSDTLEITLPASIYTKVCTADFKTYSVTDDINFGFPCGTFYFRFYNSSSPSTLGDFYSEVFVIGEPFYASVSAVASQVGPSVQGSMMTDLEVTSFVYNLATPAGTGIDTNIPDPYTFIVSLAGAALPSSTLLTFTITTNVGTFVDKYLCNVDGGGTLTIVKQYS